MEGGKIGATCQTTQGRSSQQVAMPTPHTLERDMHTVIIENDDSMTENIDSRENTVIIHVNDKKRQYGNWCDGQNCP